MSNEQPRVSTREWCLVIDAQSSGDADRIGNVLRDRQLDLEVEDREGRVLCFADSEAEIRWLAQRIRERLTQASLWERTIRSGHLRRWSDQQHRYVDPEHPDDDLHESDLDPDEIRWRVRLELRSVISRHLQKQLPGLQGRVIETGPRHIDLAATDESDAEEIARATQALDGVVSATATELGRRQRWWLRQRLSGNYAVRVPDGPYG